MSRVLQAIAACDNSEVCRRYWQAHWGHHGVKDRFGWFDDLATRDHIEEVKKLGAPDLYTAGFPCPAFSVAGTGKGVRVRQGQLILHIFRFLAVALPKVVVLENVDGLQSRHKPLLCWIVRKLKHLGNGYQVHHAILNSKDHGIPHNRRRLWIIAIRLDTVIRRETRM